MEVEPDIKQPLPPNEDNHSGNDHCRDGRRYNQNRYQHNSAQPGGKFKGKIKEIADDTFDNTGPNDAENFNKSFKNIADYLQLTLGNDVSKAVQNMAPIKIVVPAPPQGLPDPNDTSKMLPVSNVDFYLWKQEHAKVSKKKMSMMTIYQKPILLLSNSVLLPFAMTLRQIRHSPPFNQPKTPSPC